MILEPLKYSLDRKILDNRVFPGRQPWGSKCSKLWRAEGSTISRSQLILSKHSVASFCSSANAIKIEANAFLSLSPLFSKAAHLPVLRLKHMWVSVPFAAKGCYLHQPPGREAAPPLTRACSAFIMLATLVDQELHWLPLSLVFLPFPFPWTWKASCHDPCLLGELNPPPTTGTGQEWCFASKAS